MADRNANIDLLFRNGLKDYEVLPPAGVWSHIFTAIRRKQKPIIILRAAALIAVLLSLSILGYKWSREVVIQMQNPELAFTDETAGYGNYAGKAQPVQKPLIVKLRTAKSDVIPAASFDQEAIAFNDESGNPSAETVIKEPSAFTPGNLFRMPADRAIIKKSTFPAVNSNNIYSSVSGMKEIEFTGQKEKSNKWSVTALASPTYYMSHDAAGDVANNAGIPEQSMVSYSGGVAFAYNLTKKLSIQSGLYYSTVGNKIDGIGSYSGFRPYDKTKGDNNFEVVTSNGTIYTENADVFLVDRSGNRVITKYNNDVFDPTKANLSYLNNSLYQNFGYLEMPIFLRYKLIDRAIDFNLIGGVSYDILVNNTVNAHVDGNKYYVGKTEGLNSFLVSSSLGMGLEYSLSEKLSLNLEPTFRYYLSPFNMMVGSKIHPYSFGVFSGLSFKF